MHWNQQTWFWLKCRFTGLWLHMPVEKLSPKFGSIPAFHSVQQNINSLLKYFPYVYMHLSEQNRTEQKRTYSLFSLRSYKDIRGTSIKYNTNGYGMANFWTIYIYSFQFLTWNMAVKLAVSSHCSWQSLLTAGSGTAVTAGSQNHTASSHCCPLPTVNSYCWSLPAVSNHCWQWHVLLLAVSNHCKK